MAKEFTDRYGKPIHKGDHVVIWQSNDIVNATVMCVNYYECEVSTSEFKKKIIKNSKKIIAL